jgi:hypothetical protein
MMNTVARVLVAIFAGVWLAAVAFILGTRAERALRPPPQFIEVHVWETDPPREDYPVPAYFENGDCRTVWVHDTLCYDVDGEGLTIIPELWWDHPKAAK